MRHPSFWQGIDTRERLGWACYDWANSAYVLCVITVLGSAYFVGVFEHTAREAGELLVGKTPALRVGGVALTAEAAWSFIIAASALIVAVSSPLLGAIADARGTRLRFLQAFCGLGVVATLGMWFALPWWGVGLLILLGNIGYEGGNVYYNAFLPDIAPVTLQGRVSAWGYALGYVGSVLVLIAALAFFVPPRGDVRDAFLMIGLWWGGFALVTFRLLREPTLAAPRASLRRITSQAWRELRGTVRNLRHTPQAGKFLLAFLLYNDGIATLISNATPYALQNIYLDDALTQNITLAELIPAIIMIQVIAAPGALFCGWLATRYGEKAALYFTLTIFSAVVTYGQVAVLVHEFYVMAAMIGVVLGGAQAVSRALFASFVPPGKSAEFFAFFAFSAKFSAMFGPLIYGLILVFTGDTRLALLSLTVFFVIGGVVLYFVNIPQGQEEARHAHEAA